MAKSSVQFTPPTPNGVVSDNPIIARPTTEKEPVMSSDGIVSDELSPHLTPHLSPQVVNDELLETILSILGITDRTIGNRPAQIATLKQELGNFITQQTTTARIDEIKRVRPHLTYPGMVYYGERMNELRSDETEEI